MILALVSRSLFFSIRDLTYRLWELPYFPEWQDVPDHLIHFLPHTHSSRGPDSSWVQVVFGDHSLGIRDGLATGLIIISRPFQWTDLGSVCVCVCVCVRERECVCVSILHFPHSVFVPRFSVGKNPGFQYIIIFIHFLYPQLHTR